MPISEDWERLLAELEDERAQRRGGASSTTAGEEAWRDMRLRIERMARLHVTREDVDDLVQNILLKLQSPDALRRLRAARAPAGYLAVMVRNAAMDSWRRATSQEIVEPIEETWAGLDFVFGNVDQEKRIKALGQALSQLSESDRLLLRLRFWDELTIAEIAGRFGVPYSTMAVRLFRMLRRLRAELAAHGSGS